MKLAPFFLAGLPVFGQGIVGMSGNFGSGPDGAMRGSATFQVSSFLPPAVINAPYSGEEVIESVQVLADGTRITRPNMGPQQKIWRDSQGRVRTERPLGPRRDANEAPLIVQISDPVAGYVYVLDTVNRVAHRVRVDARPGGPPPMQNRAVAGTVTSGVMEARVPAPATATGGGMIGYPGTMGGGFGVGGRGSMAASQRPQTTTEQLGTKTIDGVLVTGTRMTTIIPEGAQGNDRPMTTTNETWMSKELQLAILNVSQSPMSGTTTRKFANFSTNEPAPSLFMVPPGYTTVDEKDSFTIKWGEQ
jgi:hypothetical protein